MSPTAPEAGPVFVTALAFVGGVQPVGLVPFPSWR